MTWNLSAAGQATNEAAERILIEELTDAFTSIRAGTTSASIVTQYHGTVNLTEDEAEDVA